MKSDIFKYKRLQVILANNIMLKIAISIKRLFYFSFIALVIGFTSYIIKTSSNGYWEFDKIKTELKNYEAEHTSAIVSNNNWEKNNEIRKNNLIKQCEKYGCQTANLTSYSFLTIIDCLNLKKEMVDDLAFSFAKKYFIISLTMLIILLYLFNIIKWIASTERGEYWG